MHHSLGEHKRRLSQTAFPARALISDFLACSAESQAYVLHRRIWDFFPHSSNVERHFLYRIDNCGGIFRLLMSSPVEPSVPAWLGGPLESFEETTLYPVSSVVFFSARINPTVKYYGKKQDVVMHWRKTGRTSLCSKYARVEEALRWWLDIRGESRGFAVQQIANIENYHHQKIRKQGMRPMVQSIVDVSGYVKVTDPSAFSTMLKEGIGSSRAFGCGLMLVRPHVCSA